MLMTTTDMLPGLFTPLGLVSAEIGSGLLASERTVGKWLSQAVEQLETQAAELGADAVIGIRVSALVGTLLVLGTAVKLS